MRYAAALLALLTLVLSGCETSAEKSAKLEKVAKLQARLRAQNAPHALSIARPSKVVHVTSTLVLHSAEGTAAVVSLRNSSATVLRDVPIEITVKGAGGTTVYTNTTPGLASTLVSVPLLAAHATTTWIDDQVQAAGVPTSVSAAVGEGEPVREAAPQLSIDGTHLAEGEAEGTVTNHSQVSQHELVIYAVARRGGKIVAGGRALLPELEAAASAHFQVFFIGNPAGGALELLAPASTVG